jgi:hypothetical protein
MKRIATALVTALALGLSPLASAMPQDPFRGEPEAPAADAGSKFPVHSVTLAGGTPEKGDGPPPIKDPGGNPPQNPPKDGSCDAGGGPKLASRGCPGNVPEPSSSALLALAGLALLATRSRCSAI